MSKVIDYLLQQSRNADAGTTMITYKPWKSGYQSSG